jgi:hypothetical protein
MPTEHTNVARLSSQRELQAVNLQVKELGRNVSLKEQSRWRMMILATRIRPLRN